MGGHRPNRPRDRSVSAPPARYLAWRTSEFGRLNRALGLCLYVLVFVSRDTGLVCRLSRRVSEACARSGVGSQKGGEGGGSVVPIGNPPSCEAGPEPRDQKRPFALYCRNTAGALPVRVSLWTTSNRTGTSPPPPSTSLQKVITSRCASAQSTSKIVVRL